jgi:hypothetical protein
MCTLWEKLVQYVGTNYGQDISNELQNKFTVALVEPVHPDEVLENHEKLVTIVRAGQRNIQRARRFQESILDKATKATDPGVAPMKLALLQHEIAQGDFAANDNVAIVLSESEKTQFSNDWRTYRERNANLIKH